MGILGFETVNCCSTPFVLVFKTVFGMREKRGRGYWGNCENCRREEFSERQGIEVAVVEDRGFCCGG
jgi:hypothetical protein